MGKNLSVGHYLRACLSLGLLVSALILTGCAIDANSGRNKTAQSDSAQIAAAFGADGKLWRATAGTQHLYVDYSSDGGQSFSRAVAVNRQAQRIHSSSNDRPHIVVDKTGGRIWVTYAADAVQPATAYFSYSDDGGNSFSEPTPISDQAASVRASLANLALDAQGRPHFFWHDERDSNGNTQERGSSLYYASLDAPIAASPAATRVLRSACERCPVEIAFDNDGLPVLFSRFVFPIKERDQGLVKATSDGKGWSSWRVSNDNWETDACPEQGPAFSIAADGRYHVAWFTQGKNRHGLFYAWSPDHGKNFTPLLPFGDKNMLASHPVLLSLDRRVALVWQEFNGQHNQIKAMQSQDGGEHWAPARLLLQAKGAADYPLLISDGRRIYLSWNSAELGYRLLALD